MRKNLSLLIMLSIVLFLFIVAIGCDTTEEVVPDTDEEVVVDDDFPSVPITVFVPWSVGGSTDRAARLISAFLEVELGAPHIIVENRPGAAGTIAASEVARRSANGYSLMYFGIDALVLGTFLVDSPGYTANDFVPLYHVELDPRFIYVRDESPFQSMDDLIRYARQNPGEISIAFTTGSGGHWVTEYIVDALDLPVKTVGFPGGGPATTALLGGHIDAYLDGGSGRLAYAGELRPIGVVFDERMEPWPDAVPLVEQEEFINAGIESIPGVEVAITNAMWVHKDLLEKYPARFDKLVNALTAVRNDPEFQGRVVDLGAEKMFVWNDAETAFEILNSTIRLFENNPHITQRLIE